VGEIVLRLGARIPSGHRRHWQLGAQEKLWAGLKKLKQTYTLYCIPDNWLTNTKISYLH
jgi:hypothetical protein